MPEPAGTLLIVLPLPIPVKLNADACVFIGVGHPRILTHRPDDHGRLHAVDPGDAGGSRRAIVHVGRDRFKRTGAGEAARADILRRLDDKVDRRGQIRRILIPAGMALELKRPAGREAVAVGRAAEEFAAAGQFAHADFGERGAVGLCGIRPGIFKPLEIAVRVAVAGRIRGVEFRGGVREIVILEGDLPGRHAAARLPVEDVLDARSRRAGRGIADLVVAGKRMVRVVGIGELHRMGAGGMLRVVADAEPLREAMDEVEVGLIVLRAEFKRRQVAEDPRKRVAGEAQVAEDLVEDFLRIFLLEDPTIGRKIEQPQPRYDEQAVAEGVAEPAGLAGLEADARKVSSATRGQRHADGDRLPEQPLEVDFLVGADDVDDTFKRLPNRLPVAESPHRKGRVSQWRGDLDPTHHR